jgi:hypothetical protein
MGCAFGFDYISAPALIAWIYDLGWTLNICFGYIKPG